MSTGKFNQAIMAFVMLLFALNVYTLAKGQEFTFCTPNTKEQRIFKISHAVLKEAFSRLGHGFALITYPAKRCPVEIEKGNVDGDSHRIFSFNAGNQYPSLIRIEAAIQSIDQSIFTKDTKIKPNGWASVRSYDIIYFSGIKVIEDGLKIANVPDTQKIPVFSHEQAFEMLSMNRGDLVIVNSNTGKYFLKKMGLLESGIKLLTPPLVTFDLYPYMHRKHKDLAAQLAIVINDMKKDGTYRKIIAAHP